MARRCSRNVANHGYGAGVVDVADDVVDAGTAIVGRAGMRTRKTPATNSHRASVINARPAVGVVAWVGPKAKKIAVVA